MTEQTTMPDELRAVAKGMIEAGIPRALVAQEMVAVGSAMLAESLGPTVAAKLLRAAASALDEAKQ